jgi:hypothetical protein
MRWWYDSQPWTRVQLSSLPPANALATGTVWFLFLFEEVLLGEAQHTSDPIACLSDVTNVTINHVTTVGVRKNYSMQAANLPLTMNPVTPNAEGHRKNCSLQATENPPRVPCRIRTPTTRPQTVGISEHGALPSSSQHSLATKCARPLTVGISEHGGALVF